MTIPEATTSAAALGLRLETTMTVFPGRPARIYTQYPRPFTSPSQDFDGTVYVSVANGLLASGRSATEFRTTGGAAYCQVAGTWPVLTCWTPKSGRMVTVGAGDIAKPSMRFHRLAIGARPKGLRTVGYGASWVWRKADETGRRRIVLRCYSDRRALTCENDYRSGFRLARNGTYGSWAKTEV
ncbi:hypothetical protein [Miltoncostaea oceani]|uniref:hypothetical protein n=1 Tax=Miltoncostaea oceani TaxID=2843216 RepID=UPI001C3C283E|nr:hypothetical protein [Miltoncostaea oceani]